MVLHILVVDDEAETRESIVDLLVEEGFQVSTAIDGPQALDFIANYLPDLVVLDISMPDMSGVEVCRHIRADPFSFRLPVLFLTSKGRPMDVAEGLDAGGDDYVVKPFDTLELPARIRALLRRTKGMLDGSIEHLTIGRLKLSVSKMEAWFDGRYIELTPTEHRLTYCLITHQGHPIPPEQLLQDIWGYPQGVGDPQLVRVHIGNLRRKLDVPENAPEYICNVHGRGYMIR